MLLISRASAIVAATLFVSSASANELIIQPAPVAEDRLAVDGIRAISGVAFYETRQLSKNGTKQPSESFVVVGDKNENQALKVTLGKGADGIWHLEGKDGEFDSLNDGAFRELESLEIAVSDGNASLELLVGEHKSILIHRASKNEFQRIRLPPSLSDDLRTLCNRGLEGLAAKWTGAHWRVALLWEGGYLERGAGCGTVQFKRPRLLVFNWFPDRGPDFDDVTLQRLDVPSFEKSHRRAPCDGDDYLEITENQGFRAPDLAWLPAVGDGNANASSEDRLAVLLASTDKRGKRPYKHTWLVVFDGNGDRDCSRKPLALNDINADTDPYWKNKNWEALDVKRDGRFVLGYDTSDGASELVFIQNPWASE